jgi:predicted nucleotidyltransferase
MDKQAVLTRLSDCMEEIRQRFSVNAFAIFGSIARDEAAHNSDVVQNKVPHLANATRAFLNKNRA